MLTKSAVLKFYKRKDVQDAMIEHARGKEVGMRFGTIFGSRPDVLSYPRDVLELVLKNINSNFWEAKNTISFHSSEENWENPLAISSKSSKKDLDELRIGWDLVLDIDCPDWEISKLTTHLFIKALQENGVTAVTVKFSGNKGFHIGVPFEAFPGEVTGKQTKDIFPEGPKKIAQYLLDLITKKYVKIKDNKVVFDEKFAFSLPELKEKFGDREFLNNSCKKCNRKIKLRKIADENDFVCANCDTNEKSDKDFLTCVKCNILMEKMDTQKTLCSCGSDDYSSTFDPLSILEIDTVLISSRHLYRMPWSLHEKSGLISLPIAIDKVLDFDKSMAKPENIGQIEHKFLDREVDEATARDLLARALDFEVKIQEERKPERKYEELVITSPITEEFFPDCIKKILKGMEDGKKRGMFCLMNFLGKLGWQKQDIEDYIKEWNKKNPDPLREVYIKGQMHSFKAGDKLPPNCNNEAYYQDLGLKCERCKNFKNPVNYTLWRWRRHLQDNPIKEEGVVEEKA
jgi:hypothetical protein